METKELNEVVENKPYNPDDYHRATLEEYGYKDHKVLKKTWKVVSILLMIFALTKQIRRIRNCWRKSKR